MTGNPNRAALGVLHCTLVPAVVFLATLTLACGGEDQGGTQGAETTNPSATSESLPPGSPRIPTSQQASQEIELSDLGFDSGAPDAPEKSTARH